MSDPPVVITIHSPCGCDLTVEQARTIRAKLNASEGAGRPKVLRPCKYCRRKFGAVELRKHIPQCERRA